MDRCRLKSVIVGRGSDPDVVISFMRTVRIPEDERNYPLPPGLGKFSLSNIQTFRSRLPPEMVAQGGLFLPMYRKLQPDVLSPQPPEFALTQDSANNQIL